jgi:hypothetical protein
MSVERDVEYSSKADAVDESFGPARAWAGRGKGTRCDHCYQPIETDQIEYEIELLVDKHLRIVTVHLDCYEEWILLQPPRSHCPSPATEKAR